MKYDFTIKRDGKILEVFKDQKNDFCILKYFIDKTSQSMSYALEYNGYSIECFESGTKKQIKY